MRSSGGMVTGAEGGSRPNAISISTSTQYNPVLFTDFFYPLKTPKKACLTSVPPPITYGETGH